MNKTELKRFVQSKIMIDRPEDYSKITRKLINRAMDFAEGALKGSNFISEGETQSDGMNACELLETTYNWMMSKI